LTTETLELQRRKANQVGHGSAGDFEGAGHGGPF
jgi:hypothetical protein